MRTEVEGDQYRGLQEPLGRNRRPASLCVHPIKLRRERRQGLVRQGLDHSTQRMLWLPHSALQVDEAKHGHLKECRVARAYGATFRTVS